MEALTQELYNGDFEAFSIFDRAALYATLSSLPPKPIKALELGSWLGNGSTQVFIDFLKPRGGALYCVDTFRGSPQVERHQKIVSEYDVLGTFRRNVFQAGGQDLVKILVMNSREAAGLMADESFDLVFIDADHAYASVKEDIGLWAGKVKKGGILCGHDCEGRPSAFSIEVLRQNLNSDTCAGNRLSPIVHPGPIMAVDEAFHGQASLWSEKTFVFQDGVRGRSSIWYITRP